MKVAQSTVSKLEQTPIVSIADNDQSARNALEQLVRSLGWLARPFASGFDFLASPRNEVPGCLILEVKLPDLNGLELQRRMADRPETPVIFVADQSDITTIVQAMKAGALEFMTKPVCEEAILSALAVAIERSRDALRRDKDLQTLRDRYDALSCREREVMTLVVKGLLNKVIAAELGISEITVKVHRGRVMRKMQVRSLPELVIIAARLRGQGATRSAGSRAWPSSVAGQAVMGRDAGDMLAGW